MNLSLNINLHSVNADMLKLLNELPPPPKKKKKNTPKQPKKKKKNLFEFIKFYKLVT